MEAGLKALAEEQPGDGWKRLIETLWPAYETWFLREGDEARPSAALARAMLGRYMPGLVPTYERLVELAGGHELVARFLPLYRPPPFLTGCSQAVLAAGEPVLVRNYDYAPHLWEATLHATAWTRRVIGMGECLWGLLDGMNDAGLAAALAFGGRRVVGDGFGIPLVLRHVLERCAITAAAVTELGRVPCHMAYNVTLIDAAGDHRTVYLAPDRPPVVERRAASTNHQEIVDWPEHARLTGSLERERFLAVLLADPRTTAASLAAAFLEPPLYATRHDRGRGTLYTAVYYPRRGEVEYLWPDRRVRQSFARFEAFEMPLAWAAPMRSPSGERGNLPA